MNRRIIPWTIFLFLIASSLPAQNCPNLAGNITIAGHSGQSNDTSPPGLFLCRGDSLFITHDGNANLSGDPDPATPPGIGYALYDCAPDPAFAGSDLATVTGDPCLNTTDPIFPGGVPEPLVQGIWLLAGQPNGDFTLVNNGDLQQAFSGGDPLELWLAPITVDDFGTLTYERDGMGGPDGPCVNVNTDEAFSVVLLNPIQTGPLSVPPGFNDCRASFSIDGGLPQWDPTATYQVDIALSTDPSVQGSLLNAPGSGGNAVIEVPQPGQYTITVSDGKSCSSSFTANLTGCTSLSLQLPFENALPGQNICLPIAVEGFNDIQSIQLSINWDPSVLQFTNAQNFNPSVPGLGAATIGVDNLSGALTLSWFDITFTGVDLADGQVLFEICFDVVGNLGDFTPVFFSNSPTDIEITDTNGDPLGFNGQNGQVNVTDQDLFAVITTDSTSCGNTTDGAFSIVAFGGQPPYDFTWQPLPAGAVNGPITIPSEGGLFSLGNLAPGDYEIRLTDQAVPSAELIDTFTIAAPPLLEVDLAADSPLCNGDSTGTLSAEVLLGGVPVTDLSGYTFFWSAGGPDAPTRSDLPAGNYAVTVTAPDGCTAVSTIALTDPPLLQLDATLTDATCPGSNDGSIVVTALGGSSASGDYTFAWSNGAAGTTTTFTLNDLAPDSLCLTVRDDNACQVDSCFVVGLTKTLQINSVVTDVSCFNACDGQITVTGATQGAAPSLPYTFNWSGPITDPPANTNTTSQLDNLCEGTYILNLVDADAAMCSLRDTFTIVQPDSLEVSLVETTPANCFTNDDGSATIAVTGGTPPYAYLWPDNQTDSIATGLAAGNYGVQVTDANGCIAILDVLVPSPNPPTLAPIANDTIACANTSDGNLVVNASGEPVSSYAWSSGDTSFIATDLAPGSYTVTVTGANGCTAIDSASVIAPPPLVLLAENAMPPLCQGDSTGAFSLQLTGGTAPYTFTWDLPGGLLTTADSTLNDLPAGNYSLSVTDANNCPPLEVDLNLPDAPAIGVTVTNLDSASCFDGLCDGQASLLAEYSDGSMGTFDFVWASGQLTNNSSTSTASMLCAGWESVTITDADGCVVEDSVLILSPPAIAVDVNVDPVRCNGEQNGAIQLSPQGGQPPFTYLWVETGDNTPTLSDLPAGTYNAVITDNNLCSTTRTVEVGEPDPLIIDINTFVTEDITCNGDQDGTLGVRVNTGANINPLGPTPFSWSGNVAGPADTLATGLAAGDYSVTVTDTRGCRDSVQYTISEPDPIQAVVPQPVPPLCFGDATRIAVDTAFGGNGNSPDDYTYIVDFNGIEFSLDETATVFAGPHTVAVLDPLGCAAEFPLEITQPQPIDVFFDPDRILVELGDSIRLEPNINQNEIPPIAEFAYTPSLYLSDSAAARPFVKPNDDIEYTLTVTDVNGCRGSGRVFIELDNIRNIFIPNVFSPNGDGANDEFRIFTCQGVQSIGYARLFDRWGNFVKEELNLLPDCNGHPFWDGRFNGEPMPAGVYVYIIEVTFEDGRTLLYRGDVLLLR